MNHVYVNQSINNSFKFLEVSETSKKTLPCSVFVDITMFISKLVVVTIQDDGQTFEIHFRNFSLSQLCDHASSGP